MSNARAIIIYWGSDVIQTEFGPNVVNATSRLVTVTDDFDLHGLHNLIIHTTGISDTALIRKICFRHPVMGYYQTAVYGFMEIENEFHVRHIFDMLRRFTSLTTIELYVEFTDFTFAHAPVVEGSSLRSNVNSVNVMEREVDECLHEEDEEEDRKSVV